MSMAFDTTNGTRGARQPGGRVLRLLNRVMSRSIRRGGKLLGGTDGLVLTTVGRKSGQRRSTPLVWFPGPDGSWLIVASAAGAARNPAWYHNIAAHPDRVDIEIGGRAAARRGTGAGLAGDHRRIVPIQQIPGADRPGTAGHPADRAEARSNRSGLGRTHHRQLSAVPPRARAKNGHPPKTCQACGRPFEWRRKWARDWDTVRYCSQRCRRQRRGDAGGGPPGSASRDLSDPPGTL